MAGVNKVIVIGRLGRDPELRAAQNGTVVVTMAVATSESWTDKATGQKQEKTEWHRITVFGKQGENCKKYLAKGSQVYIEGRLQTDKYEKDGQTHYSTSIIANTVQFLGSPSGAGGGQGSQGSGGYQGGQGGYQPKGGGGYNPNGESNKPQGQHDKTAPGPGDGNEDDIPF